MNMGKMGIKIFGRKERCPKVAEINKIVNSKFLKVAYFSWDDTYRDRSLAND